MAKKAWQKATGEPISTDALMSKYRIHTITQCKTTGEYTAKRGYGWTECVGYGKSKTEAVRKCVERKGVYYC